MKILSLTALCILSMFSSLALAQDNHLAFVACPVMRDMELPSLPCWLADDGENLYFLGLQSDTIPPVAFYPPQLKHRVLVEGDLVANGEEMVCGGIALENVTASVLPELDLTCDTILPQAGYTAPEPVKLSPPFTPGYGLATAPPDEEAAQYTGLRRPPLAEEPYVTRTFPIGFLFGQDFLQLDDGFFISTAVWYYKDIDGSKVTIDVYRDRVELSNGEVLEEDASVARRRAERIQSILVEWGVPAANIAMKTDRQPAAGGRLVNLIVEP